ncbi:MAG: ATP-binding protein [Eubacterium sp.]
MTKKILSKLLCFSVATVAVTALIIISVFYSYYDKQSMEELNTIASVVEAQLNQNADYSFISNGLDSQTRVTLIAPDGTVLADSKIDPSEAENHSDRQEFKEALENGESKAIRKSVTFDENTYYYAKLLNSGNVLRVSTVAQSVMSVFSGAMIYIIIALILIIAAAVIVGVRITKSIVKPVVELGEHLEEIDSIETPDELTPFVDALKEQKKKQKMLDKQKKQFTANVSHELKTPLTSIAGYAELIETGMAKPEDIKPFASTIRKQALRLVSLSEDIIQLSQLEESDEQDIVFESVDLYCVCQRCIEALSINARLKNVAVSLKGESCYIRGSSALLEELVYNLCDNAIRYNKENGSVNVSIIDDGEYASLCVEDTGIGIEEKYQDRIFERFFRVDKSRSKATGGTGLGLAIVKHAAQLHGAELKVSSVLGEGTRINVKFKK